MIIMEKSGVLSKNKVTVVDKGLENLKDEYELMVILICYIIMFNWDGK